MPLPYSRLWARAPAAARRGGARRWEGGPGVLGRRERPGMEGAHLRDHWGHDNLTPPRHVYEPRPGLRGWKAGTRALAARCSPRPRRALPTRCANAPRGPAAGGRSRRPSLPTPLREFRNPKAFRAFTRKSWREDGHGLPPRSGGAARVLRRPPFPPSLAPSPSGAGRRSHPCTRPQRSSPASVSRGPATLAWDRTLPRSAEGSAFALVKRGNISPKRETDCLLDSSRGRLNLSSERLQRRI